MTDSSSPPQPAFGETTERRPTPGFGAAGLLVGILAVVVVVGGLVGLAVAGTATPANRVRLLGGSIVLPDNRPLTVVNRATGQPTAQLQGVNTEVGAPSYSDVQAVPFDGGTLLVNRQTGTFNLLEADNYVADRAGPGVGLGPLNGTTSASGYAAGSDAYILRRGPYSNVSLVDAHTVTEAANDASNSSSRGSKAPTTVAPVGFAKLHGLVTKAFGSVAVARGSLWALVQGADGCEVVAVAPSPGRNGTLPTSVRSHPANCIVAALASGPAGTVGLATSGQVTLYPPTDLTGSKGSRPHQAAKKPETIPVPALANATRILPVTGDSSELWYLADRASGWEVVGVDPATKTASTKPLKPIVSAGELPAPPVISEGQIYTLPRLQNGQQPPLWVINPTTGAVGTVKGDSTYPKANKTEQDDFGTAGVVVSGPRVVYNNPGSLLAVMVFTDGSHRPVQIAKSAAPDIAPSGPAQVAGKAAQMHGNHGHGHGHAHGPRPKGQPGTTTPTTVPKPKTPAASPTVNCATTTEKPYAPTQITVAPSSESAEVSWHYNLLTDADCEPQTWTVTLHAIGAPQPSNPVQVVDGQQQLDVTGLRPSTRYKVFVTAYIRHQSTQSAPTTFKTAAHAADPPTSVTAHVTPTGSWVVDWTACHRADCYTPAAKWVVTGSACGGSYAGSALSAQVAGSQSSVTFDAAGLGRLGQSLRFSVQGVSAFGLPGNPVSEPACLQSWRPPQRSGIALAAGGHVVGTTIDATLSVAPALSDASVYGSQQTDLQYMLNGKPVGAPTTSTTYVATGLSADTTYRASVAVWPAGHPSARVVIDAPTAVKDDLQWSPSLTASLHVTPNADNPDVGTVTATFVGLQAGSYRTGGNLVCGSASTPLAWTALSGDVATFDNFNLVQNGGTCTANLTIDSTQQPDPYGTPDSLRGLLLQMPSPPTYAFGASYTQSPCLYITKTDVRCTDTVTVTPRGGQRLAGINWQIVASQGSGGTCSHTTTSAGVPSWPQTLQMAGCRQTSDGLSVNVHISWQYLGQTGQAYATAGGQSGNPPPTTTTTTTQPIVTLPTPPTTKPSPPTTHKHHHPHPPPSTTTTSTTTTSTTTTTIPCTTTTSPPSTGPTTTGPTTTNPGSTTTTTTCGQGSSSGAAGLTASRGQSGPPPDPGGSTALDGLFGVVVLGAGGAWAADRRRRTPSRQPRGAQ